MNIGIVLVIWIGGINVNKGNMHVGQIIAFTNYMTQILFSLMMVTNVFTMFVRAKASFQCISEVFSEGDSMINGKEILDIKSLREKIAVVPREFILGLFMDRGERTIIWSL